MNRWMVNQKIFLNNEIKLINNHIKKLNNLISKGEKYGNINKELTNTMRNLRKNAKIYKSKLNDLIAVRAQLNNFLKNLQPSTSGRK